MALHSVHADEITGKITDAVVHRNGIDRVAEGRTEAGNGHPVRIQLGSEPARLSAYVFERTSDIQLFFRGVGNGVNIPVSITVPGCSQPCGIDLCNSCPWLAPNLGELASQDNGCSG